MGIPCESPNFCKQNEKNANINIKISPFAKRISNYYIFHQKIESVFNNNQIKININNKNEPNLEENKSQKFYVLDNDWIQYWKAYAEYNSLKEIIDKEKIIVTPNNIKQLQMILQEMINKSNVKEFEQNFNDSKNTYNKFIHNNKLTIEDFDYLLDEDTYKLFQELSYLNYSIKIPYIKGIISKKLIILFIKELFIIKFLYRGKLENGFDLIQLTANCLEKNAQTNKFDMNASENKYESFKTFIKSQKYESLINLFNSHTIDFLDEITIDFQQFKIKIRNENLYSKYLKKINTIKNEINLDNLNKVRLIGLDNVGATCYMNATLQCFLNIKSLTKDLLREEIFNKIKEDPSYTLSRAYCNLLEKIWLDEKVQSHYAPNEFKSVISNKNPLFEGINANDSKDLINFLLEEMNIELSKLNEINQINYKNNLPIVNPMNMQITLENFRNDFSKKNNSIIAHNFFFIVQTNTICKGCNILKYNFQTLFLLEFPLEQVFNYNLNQNIPSINPQGKKYVNLISCFNHYKLPNEFIGENKLYCNNCNTLKEASSVNLIFSLPPVLILVLNRGKGKSFECDVDFPEKLNLENFVEYQKSICNYQLMGVISHLGESGMSGHFIAYCRHRVNNLWYLYNDSTVTLCKDQSKDYMVGTAYILFYESIDNKNNVLFGDNIDMNLVKNNTNIMGNILNNMNNMNNMNNNVFIGNNLNNNMMMNNLNGLQNNFIANNSLNNFNNMSFNMINFNNMNNNCNMVNGQMAQNFNNKNSINNITNNNWNNLNNNNMINNMNQPNAIFSNNMNNNNINTNVNFNNLNNSMNQMNNINFINGQNINIFNSMNQINNNWNNLSKRDNNINQMNNN